MTVLSEKVQVVRRFQRSIRIDTDLDNLGGALDGFVCPKSSADVLAVMARHISETGQSAFTWTGPYGTGKSSLVVALSALLTKSTAKKAEGVVGREAAEVLRRTFPLRSKGWRILPVVGRRAPASEVIGHAIVATGLARASKGVRWTDGHVLATLERLASGDRSGDYGGLIVFLDEMGKYFEAAAQDGADIFFFQQLAEAAVRSKGRLVVVGILHQAFDEYAQRLSRELRDEWAKVQGRYVDLAVTLAGDEQLDLLAQAISVRGRIDDRVHARNAKVVGQVIRQGRPSTNPRVNETLEKCWPLHPIVPCLLGPISRRRFGQNQRSLFGFLNSAEPHGFQEFIRNEGADTTYGPDRLWDYLRANLEPAILASPDAHRWSTAVEAVERADAKFGPSQHLSLLKTVALLDLFRERSGLSASEELLGTIFANGHAKSVLNELREGSFVTFRKHLGTYAIYAGSDFDIEEVVAEALSSIRELDFDELRSLAGIQPIVAKRNYHDTGALRWFDIDIVPLNTLRERIPASRDSGAVGKFLIVIPTENEDSAMAKATCEEFVKSADRSVAVGLSEKAWQLLPLAHEFIAIAKVNAENVALSGDAVARREVNGRLADARTRLETTLHELFDSATWYRSDHEPKHLSYSELNLFASAIADDIFDQCPRIQNELLNREKPSANAVSAEKALLKAMAQKEGTERLGINGFPAEGGLFDSIIQKAGLYTKARRGTWKFGRPAHDNDPCNLSPIWSESLEFLKTASDGRISMADLFSIWRQRPYGLKSGLMRVLGTAFILGEREHLAIYREGIFQAGFTDLDVDYLTADPASIQIRWIEVRGNTRAVLAELADVASSFDRSPLAERAGPIEVAKSLVGRYYELPSWVKRTNLVSTNAARIRALLKNASDPNKLLFDDLPELAPELGSSPVVLSKLVSEGLRELADAYPKMLGRLRDVLLAELGVKARDKQAYAELRARADNIRSTGEYELSAFVLRLVHFKGSDDDVESIASLVVSKPARDWVDADLEKAEIEIADFSRRFIRAETFAHVKGRDDKRHAMAVIVAEAGQQTPHRAEFTVPDSDRASVLSLSTALRAAIANAGPEDQNIILAALAEVSVDFLEPPDKRVGGLHRAKRAS